MTYSTSTFIAILIGLGVFAVIVAIGWRSVQNRRILRLQSADGQETIIVAGEDDDVSSIVTTTAATQPAPAPAALSQSRDMTGADIDDKATPPEFGRSPTERKSTL